MTALINWAAARDTLALLPVSSSIAVSTRLVSWDLVKYSAKACNRVRSDWWHQARGRGPTPG